MSTPVSVDKIASLAYLELTPDQKQRFQTQMESILGYIDQLQKIPLSAEETKKMGAFHVTTAFIDRLGIETLENLRGEASETEVAKLNLSNDEALRNAPKSSGIPGELLFEVPSIIER